MTRFFGRAVSQRDFFIAAILGVMLLVLFFELWQFMPLVLARWNAFDYYIYVSMGRALYEGANPYGVNRYYPLPTVLWVFIPLSFLPDWFRLVWVIMPVLFILTIAKRTGIFWFFFPPFWFVISDGMLEGWLLLPFYWLFQNSTWLAGLGAALLLLKPQLALPVIVFMVGKWLWTRDLKKLGVFAVITFVLWAPTFLIRPQWVGEMLSTFSDRLNQGPFMTASLWSWAWLGGAALLVGLLVAISSVALFALGLSRNAPVTPMLQAMTLLWTPIFYASAQAILIPTLRTRSQIIPMVLAGLVAWGLSMVFPVPNFGGFYVIVPLVALYLNLKALHGAGSKSELVSA